MNEESASINRDSDATIARMFRAMLRVDVASEIQGIADLGKNSLLQDVEERLERSGLDWRAVAPLLGVSETTAQKRWRRLDNLPSNAKMKLAALRVLLSVATANSAGRAGSLVNNAIASLRNEFSGSENAETDPNIATLRSVFGPAGLMAAALFSALEESAGGTRVDLHPSLWIAACTDGQPSHRQRMDVSVVCR